MKFRPLSSVLSLALVALVACTPAPPPPSTSKPAAPAESKAAAPAESKAASTEAKPAAPAAKPAAQAAAKPPAESASAVNQPQLVTDPAAMPKQFSEAPQLAELVKQGKLPPVAQRLPSEPLVIKPTDEVGTYGGTWRGVFTGVSDGQNLDRLVAAPLAIWDPTLEKVTPHVIKSWDFSSDSKSTTFHLRKGMKWSDGQPVTTEDVIFWREDLYGNKELRPTPSSPSGIDGAEGVWAKLDEYTFTVSFPSAYPSFFQTFAQNFGTHIWQGARMEGGIAPKHYLQKFHPKYAGADAANKLATDANQKSWVQHMQWLNDGHLNPELPVLDPWVMVTPTNTSQTVWERNPYYFAVDSAGNQLPYIDRLSFSLVENLEVSTLKAMSGELDLQARHILLNKLPVLLENQQKGNYRVQLARGLTGSDTGIYPQINFEADPEIAKHLNNRDFRIALSLGLERDQMNEAFWLGQGDPGSVSPDPSISGSPGPEWRKTNSTFDRAKANSLLDGIGLTNKDGQGCRMRTDGQGPLNMEMTANAGAVLDNVGIAEMAVQQWKKNLGLCFTSRGLEEELVRTKTRSRELHFRVHSATGTESILESGDLNLLHRGEDSLYAPQNGLWLVSNGQKGIKPEGDLWRVSEMFMKSKGGTEQERLEYSREILRLFVQNQWAIGTVGVSPGLHGVWVISNRVGNFPKIILTAQKGQTPLNYLPAQFYFKP